MELKQGNCMELIKELSNEVVIITDPPYGINLDLNWLSEVNLAKGTQPNKSDDKLLGDEQPVDISFLFRFKRG